MMTSRLPCLLVVTLALSCNSSRPEPGPAREPSPGDRPPATQTTPPSVDIAHARSTGRAQLFDWQPWSEETFARARREGRYILFHGAAVWCHWCHVMEETTYRDPAIGELVNKRFIAIRVDVDSRPDLAERYEDWGWPATVLLTPQAEEIGKYRGYLRADELLDILRAALATSASRDDDASSEPGRLSATPDMLGWIAEAVTRDMDSYYDERGGSWGRQQKVPIGSNAEFEARRAAHGDAAARARAAFTLAQHARLIDPVWGGIYQYSTGGSWDHPHFEKLMTSQTENLEAFARGYQVLGEPALLDHARHIADYVDRFLTGPLGTFHVSQDADVGTHVEPGEPSGASASPPPFMDGHVFYSKNEAERLAVAAPWIDRHVYGYQNGLMIAALCTLHEVSGERVYLDRARRAADAILASHIDASGAVAHDADSASTVRYLADAASVGRALARLARLTGSAPHREAAERIARNLLATLRDPASGALWAHTPDDNAAGVFTRRRHPFAGNVLAARFLAELARTTGDAAQARASAAILAAVSTPRAIDEQGRMLGSYLLAIDEASAYPWPEAARPDEAR